MDVAIRAEVHGRDGASFRRLLQCGDRLKLHQLRWRNCPHKALESELKGWEQTADALHAAVKKLRGPLLMLGDSVGRDIFTLASCLLHARHGLAEADSFGRIWNRHMPVCSEGRCAFRVRSQKDARIDFVWLRGSRRDGSWYSPSEVSAASNASAAVVSAGAHFQSYAAMVDSLRENHLWLRERAGENTPIGVVEYPAPHWPLSPAGEYEGWMTLDEGWMTLRRRSRGRAAAGRALNCTPHGNASGKEAELPFRLQASRASAKQLPGARLIEMWRPSISSFDDHMGPAAARLTVSDCRHFCNPGRTYLGAVSRIARFVQERGGSPDA